VLLRFDASQEKNPTIVRVLFSVKLKK